MRSPHPVTEMPSVPPGASAKAWGEPTESRVGDPRVPALSLGLQLVYSGHFQTESL